MGGLEKEYYGCQNEGKKELAESRIEAWAAGLLMEWMDEPVFDYSIITLKTEQARDFELLLNVY